MRTKLFVAAACAAATAVALVGSGFSASPNKTVVVYDDFSGGNNAKWNNPYGLGEILTPDADHSESFTGGVERVRAVPFKTGADFSVYDHLKYMEVSNSTFPVSPSGSVEFSADMSAATPGTVAGLTQLGIYGAPGTWTDPNAPPVTPNYSATVLEGQQSGVVLNMVDFCTGQLFDWFLSGHYAFTLIERLPSNVTNNTATAGCPFVGREKMYTQIANQIPISGGTHKASIMYSAKQNAVEYRLDGKLVTRVNNVGIPLDKQHVKFTGTYPSLGAGENLAGQIHSFSIGHGLFSLIDAFPYQHPDSPELSVSIPVGTGNAADAGRARLFGQGADGTWDNFTVTSINKG